MRLIYILSQLQQIKVKKILGLEGDKIKIYIYFTAAALRCAMAIKSSPSKWHSTPFFLRFLLPTPHPSIHPPPKKLNKQTPKMVSKWLGVWCCVFCRWYTWWCTVDGADRVRYKHLSPQFAQRVRAAATAPPAQPTPLDVLRSAPLALQVELSEQQPNAGQMQFSRATATIFMPHQ